VAIWITSGYRDCFPDSSLLGDTESGINRQRCATLQCRACTSRHRRNNYDVITSPAHDRRPRQPVMVNDIATLVRRALAEVCTVAVLLVCIVYVCTTSNINKCGSGKNTRLEMWTNAQRDGRPAAYRWRPLFNAAKFG